ncbi:TonB-dependent receptor [Paraliomyxa miuraensis]|uniref:TonB-dependent receptor n=1 Tax=Paraliomyxa miuraensis TaxID=376150 RepID=UPI00225370B5|nr:TonB-dependent receptor plug domain-containing protein [Paraliomyxa miuraensis]MCX4245325.1 TonB-dependent receptor [Paraliomyxa miuraensis]
MTGSIALALWLGTLAPPSPCTDTVEGRVVDESTGEPVAGALVRLGEASVETDQTGHFELHDVCPGDHALTVERPEYHTVRQQVAVDGDTAVDVHALPREVEHDDHVLVKVAATAATETRASDTLEGEALARTRGKGFADAVAGVPGVTVLRSSAGGLGKPIIRGQYGRRNLLLFDGVRHQGQEWGIDHAPEIDPFSAGSITVIKGAGSIRHGPDAVGGVVLVDPPPLPREPGVRGQAHLVGVSNGRQGVSALRIDGTHRRLPGFAWRVEGNATRAAGLSAPDYPLDNTGSLVWNAGGSLGYQRDAFEVRLSYRRHFQQAGICTCLTIDSPESFAQTIERGVPVGVEQYTSEYRIERPFQRVTHDLAAARGRVMLPRAGQLHATYAFQDNHRQEYAVVRQGVEGPQIELRLRTHTGDVAFEHAPVPLSEGLWLEGVAGVGGLHQRNAFDSNQTLIPDYVQLSGGAFVLERVVTERFEMQWGVRYDGMQRTSMLGERDYLGQTGTGRLDPDDCERTPNGGGRCRFPFHAPSGSYGVLVRAARGLELRADLTSTARFPNVDEHFLNGIAPSFPVLGLGGSALGVERTWGSSLTASTSHRWLRTETSGFFNYVDEYIYFAPEPTDGPLGLNETIRGTYQVFSFRPVDAVFYGAEHAFVVAPPRWPVSIDGQLSVVRARDVTHQGFLVFVPPGRYRLGVTYRWPEAWRLRNGYVSVGGTLVDHQRRYDLAADFAPPPPAYFLLGAAAGVELPLGDQVLSLGLEGGNLTNARYRQYTSLLRYFADEPGWELRLRLSLDFALDRPGRHEHGRHEHHHR